MAGHLAEAGVAVAGIIEQKDACSGMLRNQKRLKGYDIPFIFGTTIREICGYPQLEGVILSDDTWLSCRTLLIAAGLVPEQGLLQGLVQSGSAELSDWLHICGNARQVHPMVEGVISDGNQAGGSAYYNLTRSI